MTAASKAARDVSGACSPFSLRLCERPLYAPFKRSRTPRESVVEGQVGFVIESKKGESTSGAGERSRELCGERKPRSNAMRRKKNQPKRGPDKAPSSGKVSGSSQKRKNWPWVVGAIVCVGIAGFFLARHLSVTPGEKKAPPSRPAPAWPDPDPNAPPEEVGEHLKAEGLEVGKRIMRDLPGKVDSILLMGQVHYRHGNTSEAIALWEKGLKLDPKRADAYDGMAWVALRKGDYATAVSHWRKALEIQPRMPGAHNSLARALMGLGRTKEAASALEKDVEASPRSSLSYFLLAQAYLQLKQYEKAEAAYRKAIEIDPACTNAYYGLGTTLVRLRQREKAKECMKKFQELKAEDMKTLKSRNRAYDDMIIMRVLLAETHEDAGRIYRKYGKLPEAEEHWRRAAALDPKNSSCRMQLASLYERTRRIPEAISMYEEVRKLEPKDLGSCLAVASAYGRVGRFSEAEKALREAIGFAPESSWAYRDLARLYLHKNKNVREAKALAEKAAELEPSAANYDILGWAFYANREVAASLSAIQRAMELDPTNPAYKRRYEQIRRRQ